jgi:uncharacterized protein YndB with AHSA1/START domain
MVQANLDWASGTASAVKILMTNELPRRTNTTGYDLKVERDFDAPPQAVFDAYLAMHGEHRPDWILESQLDLRVGGAWTVRFQPPGLKPFSEARVLTGVDPPQHLSYATTAIVDGEPTIDTNVDIAFEERGEGTRVSLRQSGFPSSEERDDFAGGWPGVLETLGDFLA